MTDLVAGIEMLAYLMRKKSKDRVRGGAVRRSSVRRVTQAVTERWMLGSMGCSCVSKNTWSLCGENNWGESYRRDMNRIVPL